MDFVLNAAAFIAFAAFFAFLFYMAGDLWMNASKDAIGEEAELRRQTGDAGAEADPVSAPGAADRRSSNAGGAPAL